MNPLSRISAGQLWPTVTSLFARTTAMEAQLSSAEVRVSDRDGFLLVGIRDHGEHRPEDLLLRDRRLGVHAGEDRRLDEPAPLESLRAPASGRDAAAVGLALGDVGLHAVPLPLRDQRADPGGRVERAENGGLPSARVAESARSGRYLSLLERQRIPTLPRDRPGVRPLASPLR